MAFDGCESDDSNRRHELMEEKVDMFSDLPDEIVIRILSFLDSPDLALRAELVCLRFARLCQDPSLWKRLVVPSSEVFHDLSPVLRILERCGGTRLEEISIGSQKHNNLLALTALAQCPESVTKIRVKLIGDSWETRHEVKGFLRSVLGTSVRVLEISGYVMSCDLIDTAACLKDLTTLIMEVSITWRCNELFKAIGESCKKLEVCVLSQCMGVKDDGLNSLVDGLKKSLEEISVNASECTGASIKNISRCASLRKLKIVWTGKGDASGALSAIVELPKLESLAVWEKFPPAIRPDEFVDSFGGRRRRRLHLKHLELRSSAVDDSGLEAIADSCGQELRSLDVFSSKCKITCAVGLTRLLSSCLTLRELRLGEVSDWSPSAFLEALGEATSPLVRLGLLGKHRWTLSEDDLEVIGTLRPGLVIEKSNS